MPFYRMGGLMVHVKMGGRKHPAPCRAEIQSPDGKRERCCGISGYLCDWKLDSGHTCDKPLCDAHAHPVGRNRHYCAEHLSKANEQQPQLPLLAPVDGG